MKEKIEKYIKDWKLKGYYSDIPDEANKRLETLNKVPSYRKICIAILKNDHSLKTLGLNDFHSKYYDYYKKIELENRNPNKQLKLDL